MRQIKQIIDDELVIGFDVKIGALVAPVIRSPPGVGYNQVFIGKGGIARMGLFQFFQPVSGVILAALLLGETIGWSFLGASGVIMLGVWFAVRAK